MHACVCVHHFVCACVRVTVCVECSSVSTVFLLKETTLKLLNGDLEKQPYVNGYRGRKCLTAIHVPGLCGPGGIWVPTPSPLAWYSNYCGIVALPLGRFVSTGS